MIKFLEIALTAFRVCFKRKATYGWFVAAVLGIMVRTDKLGVTSIIRSLGLAPIYEPLNRFFRSSAWDLVEAECAWSRFVNENALLYKAGGYAVLVGDGVKVSKEGKRIPAVKRMYQESETSSKPEYIMGQMFGSVGILAEGNGKTYCISLACEMQDGVREIMSWVGGGNYRQGTHVVEMAKLAHCISSAFGKTILLLDRYFLAVPALSILDELNAGGGQMQAIIMAKANTIAYQDPPKRIPGTRGRPRIKGKAVKLSNLFNSEADRFKTAEVSLYGKRQQVRYLSVDLLWGQGLYRKMRFVLVEVCGRRSIIACTDTSLDPVTIIELYGKRFSIECTFRSMKQDVGVFTNRFWTLSIPKLRRYAKSDEPDRELTVTDVRARANIINAFDASEKYVFCGVVALGLLQMFSLNYSGAIGDENIRYLRTPSKSVSSEATIADWLGKHIIRDLVFNPELRISQIIMSKINRVEGGDSIRKAS
jgi:hypothetical protein